MKRTEIKIGQKFNTRGIMCNNLYKDNLLTIKKIENLESGDGWITYDSERAIGRRKYNHKARVWWVIEFCVASNRHKS